VNQPADFAPVTEPTAIFDTPKPQQLITPRSRIKMPFKSKEGASNPFVQQMLSPHEQGEITEY
jgi:hypothetical protein